MRVLLDTHTFLWFVIGDPRLPVAIRDIIQDPTAQRYVSLASCWEIPIKHSRGRLELNAPLAVIFSRCIEGNGLLPLSIERRHLIEIPTLPHAHGDPCDAPPPLRSS